MLETSPRLGRDYREAMSRRFTYLASDFEQKSHQGNLVLDLTTRRAHLGDTVADLTAREFQLLRQLAESPGEVISRERLLSEVWGYHFDPSSNVLEVCIRRLRKKLGPEAPIQTVRHAGYRVSAT